MNMFKKILSIIRGEQNINKLLRRGLVVGNRFKRMGGVIIDPSHCWHISIGDDVTLAPRVHILAHDASTYTHLGYTKVSNTKIGNRVFIGAASIVLPGVTIGDDVIIGAGSIVTKSIPSGMVAAGNPAKVLCTTEEYIMKEKSCMNEHNCFCSKYTVREKISSEDKIMMVNIANNYSKCFVK